MTNGRRLKSLFTGKNMTTKIILQKLVEKEREQLEMPAGWQYRDLKKFGLDWELFPYQQKAIENCTTLLYLLFRDMDERKGEQEKINKLKETKKNILSLYKNNGLDQDLENSLAITEESGNFKFLSQFFPAGTRIPFETFLNRAAFWMATGSGKTLVMVKLLAVLGDLIDKKLIPQKDILILAPKDDILNQIKEHIDIFNKGSEITINLKNLKEYERVKNQQSIFNKNEITVFYYRADNISGKDMVAKKKDGQRLNYESIYNDGNWYVILDEAHKGEKETSLRQQYYMVLAKNGFLFNFSATFTDDLDIATTVFDYKLNTFLKEGYGKKLYIADANFQNFNQRNNTDFTDNDKKNIIAQSFLTLALAKKHFHNLREIDKSLYHSPLLITLANSVNTEESDLKIFYKLLSEIAIGNFDFERAKRNLVEKLEGNRKYLFDLGEIDLHLIAELRLLKDSDLREAVFNTKKTGNIEVVKFRDNNRELAFKLINSDKYFMLIVASNITEWENNILESHEFGTAVEESFFEGISKKDNINLLLGSRIFSEGWDTNRPNIINFINIGVSSDAKKYVLQSIGRGIRIEPVPGQRKRFENLDSSRYSDIQKGKIIKSNQILESLFLFATKKEAVQTILDGLPDTEKMEWIRLNGIEKSKEIKERELPIFIPVFKDAGLNEKPFWIGTNEYTEVNDFVKKSGPKVLLLRNNIKLRTYKKVIDKVNFNIVERRRRRTAENILFVADSYFNEPIKKLSEIKILDGEISHYKEVKTNIGKVEAGKLEADIAKILRPKKTSAELFQMVRKGMSQKEFEKLDQERIANENIDTLHKYLEFKVLGKHYYSPILFKQDSEKFQHIIKEKSEIDFLEALKNYTDQDNNNLKKFDWWFFSKIEQNVDKIGIPYFDSESGEYRTFFPDFIFWLKKGEEYHIKFIDPHGVQEGRDNSVDKIMGFNSFVEDVKKIKTNKNIFTNLYFYNENKPGVGTHKEYRKYWTSDFNKMFSL